jgi:hypothetical protein
MPLEHQHMKESEGVRRAREVYRRLLSPQAERENYDKLIAFDAQSDDFEIGEDDIEIVRRLRARRPNSMPFVMRVGDGGRPVDRFGSARFMGGK